MSACTQAMYSTCTVHRHCFISKFSVFQLFLVFKQLKEQLKITLFFLLSCFPVSFGKLLLAIVRFHCVALLFIFFIYRYRFLLHVIRGRLLEAAGSKAAQAAEEVGMTARSTRRAATPLASGSRGYGNSSGGRQHGDNRGFYAPYQRGPEGATQRA
jgi:hypothetical protein